jgi:hypothetical protein
MKTKNLISSVILFLGIVFIASGQNKNIQATPPPGISFNLFSGSDRQTVCENFPISTITYAITPSEPTSVSGLPSGVTWSILGDRLTISGTPTNAGIYNYVVSISNGNGQLTGILTVTAKTTPIFSQLAPINSGDTLGPLPTTSTNGITGTWLPAPNNTATTTYTFTPSDGQCANTTTMTIAVNTIATPTQNLCIRDTQSYSVNTTDSSHAGSTYAWSISPTIPNIVITGQGTNSITIDWSNAPYGSYTLQTVETNAAGCLSTPVNATINLTQPTTPTFTQVSPICSGATLTALPTTSNNGITGTWLPAINNVATTTYAFTPTAGLCGTTATMTIVVNPNVTPTFTQIAPICSGATLTALPTTSSNGVSGTWLPAINPNITTTYTFTPTAGQCSSTTTQTIIITAPVVTSPISFVAPVPVASIGVLNVGSATITGTLTNGIAASGVSASIPYTGGNGISYAAQTISSTGVSGLTATLLSGVLANGAGSLLYTISGTPSASGTVSFTITIGGQSGTFTILMAVNLVAQYPTGSVFCASGPTAIVDVTNPTTGRIWMDRNLGASRAATSSTDANAYGDLYQWGRRSDGHQCRTSPTTTTLSSTDQPSNGNFIVTSAVPYNWRNPENTNLWQGVNGINNPCPIGYRLPTQVEFEEERVSWSINSSSGAFASPLKLLVAGGRYFTNGDVNVVDGRYWSSTISLTESRFHSFNNTSASMYTDRRSYGMSVRCIKN